MDFLKRAGGECEAEGGVGEDGGKIFFKFGGFIGRREERVGTVGENFGETIDGGSGDRDTGSHRFEEGHGEAFVVGRNEEGIEGVVEGSPIRDKAAEGEVGDLEPGGFGAEGGFERAGAGEEELGGGEFFLDAGGDIEPEEKVFLRDEATDATDDGAGGVEAEEFFCVGSFGWGRREELVGIDAVIEEVNGLRREFFVLE